MCRNGRSHGLGGGFIDRPVDLDSDGKPAQEGQVALPQTEWSRRPHRDKPYRGNRVAGRRKHAADTIDYAESKPQ